MPNVPRNVPWRTFAPMASPCLVGDERAARDFLDALQTHGPTAEAPKCFYFQLLTRQKYGSELNRILFGRLVELDELIDAVYDATPARGFYHNGPIPLDSMVVVSLSID